MVLLLVAASATYLRAVNLQYPIEEWLFLRYATYWVFAAFLSLGCLSTGLRALAWLLPSVPRLGERWALGFALGVLGFVLGLFVAGLCGLLGTVFFFAWPGVLLVVGWSRLRREVAAALRCHGRFGFRFVLPRGPIESLAAIFLLVSAIAIYLQVMTPQNLGYDAQWYHLPIAQQYASAGRIGPFVEGWYLGAYPQLASLLYTWAFLAPGDVFDHQMLASHLEWALFLATLAAMAPFVRRLLRDTRAPFAAAALFLFPGIFLYDSNLNAGADHVLAFWAPALGIALARLGSGFTPRDAVLAGAFTAAAVLTKYQGALLVAPALLFVALLTARAKRLWPALAWAATAAILSTPYWLKNWIYYGDPIYPLLNLVLPSRPFHPDAAPALHQAYWVTAFQLSGTALERVVATLKALVSFSFVPHDWSTFHGERPVFGSLFTLTLPLLFLLRNTRRLWLLALGVHVGIVVWFVTSHQDRFLQALLPWMAACTAAILIHAWREGDLVRTAVVALVAVQIVWGSDVYFIRTHAMVGDSPLRGLGEYLGAGHRKEYARRLAIHEDNRKLGAELPAGAKLLLHRERGRLGIAAQTVVDEKGWQGAIDYLSLGGPEPTARLWRQLGITHVAWSANLGDMSPEDLAREAVFASAIRHAALEPPRSVAGKQLVKVGAGKAADEQRSQRRLRIAWLGRDGDPPAGIYDAPGLAIRIPAATLKPEQLRDQPLEALVGVDALVLRPSCDYVAAAKPAIETEFEHSATAGDVSLWLRKPTGVLTAQLHERRLPAHELER